MPGSSSSAAAARTTGSCTAAAAAAPAGGTTSCSRGRRRTDAFLEWSDGGNNNNGKATKKTTTTTKPVVVLAGWLGCEPERQLRRYEDAYRSAFASSSRSGFDDDDDDDAPAALRCVATPYMVFRSCCPPPRRESRSSPQQRCSTGDERTAEATPPPCPKLPIRDLALDVLEEVHRSDCPAFVFHAFSNGGGFLWEQIRILLRQRGVQEERRRQRQENRTNEEGLNGEEEEEEDVVQQEQRQQMLDDVRSRLVGVVFDSCPGSDLRQVDRAMSYCSTWERYRLAYQAGLDYLFLRGRDVQERISRRSRSYVDDWMEEDYLEVPQLYLFCRNDPLAPYGDLERIIEHRRRRFGADRVWERAWQDSAHCAHLLLHPDEYRSAIRSFAEHCLSSSAASGRRIDGSKSTHGDNNAQQLQSRL